VRVLAAAGVLAITACLMPAFSQAQDKPAPTPADAPAKDKSGVEQAAATAPAGQKSAVEKAAATAKPTPAKAPEEELSKEEKQVLDLVNEQRRRMGLRKLRVNAKLMRTARSHSQNMARYNSMSHYLGGSVGQRAVAHGYPSSYAAENIAQGQRGAHQVMNVWMASSGHRNNIMSYAYTEIGIGLAWSSWGTPYWTQVFGRQ
jgi:uncharacterized protein YkwD